METNIRQYVEHSCKQPENKLSPAFFSEHIMVVKNYALLIGKKYGVNSELLSVAALLHDISAVLNIETLSVHNIKSAEIAQRLLTINLYSPENIQIIKTSIEKHLVPLKENEGSIYDIILSNADAMSQIARPEYWLSFALNIRKLNEENGLKWYRNKVESNWNSLIPMAKELVAVNYHKTLERLANTSFFVKSSNQLIMRK